MHKSTIVRAALWGALLTASPTMARAEALVLTCQGGGAPPYVLKVDTDAKTVTNLGNPVPVPTLPARITDDEISWWGGDQYPQFTLSRITGNLHIVGTGTSAGYVGDHQCHKSEKQF